MKGEVEAVTRAMADIDRFLADYYPAHVKTREVVFRVVHLPEWEATYLMVDVFKRRGPDTKRRVNRYRFANLMQLPVCQVSHSSEHPRGQCKPCTAAWRYHNGFGQNVDDLDDMLSYRGDLAPWGTLTALVPEPEVGGAMQVPQMPSGEARNREMCG